MSTIVVGVDGSAESKEALRWALDEARLRHASVRVVHAWSLPALGVGLGYAPVVDNELIEGLRQAAEAVVDRTVEEVGGADGVDVDRVALEGPAALMLVEAAKEADLLVVGSRGHGGFTGLLLGSVSQQCAHHGTCPVVIVRGPKD
jgi:nucleotide-binding universal stress UspA family protein